MDNDNIIIFDHNKIKKDQIIFDSFINTDPYLQLTSLNALQKAGYEVSVEGVKYFQEMNGLIINGIIDVGCLTLLIQVFDESQMQDIISHIDREMLKYQAAIRKEKRKLKEENNNKTTKGQWIAVLWVLFFTFFFGYGLVSAITDIIHFIWR